jgi:vacuolar protein sorting-associated protein 35
MKNILPDGQNTSGGTLDDTLSFILENFKQMNVLWVRLEFLLDSRTADDRRSQRAQLKQLVGSNIQRLASLRGLEVRHYQEVIMPCILEQVRLCREPLTQYYVLESITQVFPAEFHIETLEALFGVLTQLEDEVQTLSLVTSVIRRLQTYYVGECSEAESAIVTVRHVAVQINQLLKAGQNFTLEDTLDMLSTLLNFTLEADAGNTQNVNSILMFVENHIDGIFGESRLDAVPVSRKLRTFLVTPLRVMRDASMLFDLDYFPVLVNRLKYDDRKRIALEVCEGFTRTEALIDTPEKLRSFFAIVQVLLQRPSDWEEDPDHEPLRNHLQGIARVFQLIRNRRSLDDTFALLTSVSQTIQNLEAEVKEHLYLALGQALLKIAVLLDGAAESGVTTVRQVLQLCYTLLSNNDPPPVPSLWLYLEATKISDRCGTEAITTEFFVSAYRLWKDTMLDGGLRYRILIAMIRTATELRRITPVHYGSITSELCTSAGGLLQKDQQAEAHLLCSHLFNVKRPAEERQVGEEEDEDNEVFNSPDKVKNCLVRALKAASQMMEPMDQLPWYYRVLGHAIYFIENGVELPAAWFQALTAKIDEEHETHQREIEQKLSRAHRQFYVNLIHHKDRVIHFTEDDPEE